MSTASFSTPQMPGVLGRYEVSPLPVKRFTVQEYHRLIEQGYFAADEQFELLEGWIVAKVSKNPPHEAYLGRARRMLDRRLPAGWFVRVQSAVTTDDSEPEPDLAVVRGNDELDYDSRHPAASDTSLVVEVSSSTLAQDRGIMAGIYAKAGFPTYWILNLVDRQIEVYTLPGGAANTTYGRRDDYRAGSAVPLVIDGATCDLIPVTDFLP